MLTILQRLHGDSPETLQRHHKDSTETLWRYYRDSAEILHGLYRDSAETPEILQRLQRFNRHSLETLTESCNVSTTMLLGSVAGIVPNSWYSLGF